MSNSLVDSSLFPNETCDLCSIENTAIPSTELGVIGHDIGIVALEGRIRLHRAVDHGGRCSGIACRDSLRVDKMAITSSSRKDLVSGFPLKCCVLVEDVVPVGLGGAKAAGNDLIIDTNYSVLCDVL